MKNTIQVNEERLIFQLFFLKDDEERSVEVVEAEEIDFEDVAKRIKRGESVFITSIRNQRLSTNLASRVDAVGTWYFTHI